MNRSSQTETIIALATPPGYGALSVVRLDGPKSLSILRKIAPAIRKIVPRQALLVDLYDQNNLLDEAIITYYQTPHSYTGNDLVEISCHGNPYIVDRLIELGLTYGARLAHPGEFTQRAYLNGKMTLVQAEAVAEIVFANHQLALQSSLAMLKGQLGETISSLRSKLIDLISLMELELDFSDQEIDFTPQNRLINDSTAIIKDIAALLKTYTFGRVVREGVLVAIVGPVNSGKSSLLNALTLEDRAIVTPIPGTTRDHVEGSYHKAGLLFRLTDTAGLRLTNDPVETIGIERTHALIQKADLILYVLDLCLPPTSASIEPTISNRNTIIVLNKVDIAPPNHVQEYQALLGNLPVAVISAKRHQNLTALTDLMVARIKLQCPPSQENFITIKRHYEILQKALHHLRKARRLLQKSTLHEIVITELRWALEQFDLILGKTYNQTILNNIFSHFCIGK